MHREQDGIHYYNAGGWIDSRLTYITIAEDGVRIHEYIEKDEVEGGSIPFEEPHSEAAEESEFLEPVEYGRVGA
jgi:hypothetical protein